MLFFKKRVFFVAESHAMCNQWIELVDHHRGWTSSTSLPVLQSSSSTTRSEERASPSSHSQATKPLPLCSHRIWTARAWGQQFQQLLNLLRHGDSHVVQKIFKIPATGRGWGKCGTYGLGLRRPRPLGQRRLEQSDFKQLGQIFGFQQSRVLLRWSQRPWSGSAGSTCFGLCWSHQS